MKSPDLFCRTVYNRYPVILRICLFLPGTIGISISALDVVDASVVDLSAVLLLLGGGGVIITPPPPHNKITAEKSTPTVDAVIRDFRFVGRETHPGKGSVVTSRSRGVWGRGFLGQGI